MGRRRPERQRTESGLRSGCPVGLPEWRLIQPILRTAKNIKGEAPLRSALVSNLAAFHSLEPTIVNALIQPEVYLNRDHDRHRSLAVFHSRLELVLAHRLERLLVKAHTQRTHHVRALRVALRIDDQ